MLTIFIVVLACALAALFLRVKPLLGQLAGIVLAGVAGYYLAKWGLWLPVVLAALAAGVFVLAQMLRYHGVQTDDWTFTSPGVETPFFAGKKVLFLVPHEDDELNLGGGVIQQYAAAGSQVLVVFACGTDQRRREALASCVAMGVEPENVFFLGYAERCRPETMPDGTVCSHLYNCKDPDHVFCQRQGGNFHTDGIADLPAYHSNTYSRANYKADIESLLLEQRPGVIYYTGCDAHEDHRALCLLFEEVMAEILRKTDYRPALYMGYCYATAWEQPDDYADCPNPRSTQPFYFLGGAEGEEHPVGEYYYPWEMRLRLPVKPASLGRTLRSSSQYPAFLAHVSPKAWKMAGHVINGDKVFWQRRTNSLLYGANVHASSGDPAALTDFKLFDSDDVTARRRMPLDGGWRWSKEDEHPAVTVTFDTPKSVGRVWLFSLPTGRILDALLVLEDGTQLATGPLPADGSPLHLDLPAGRPVTGFTLRIQAWEGDAGLAEIEAFSLLLARPLQWIKLMDHEGDFAYDYWTDPLGDATFSVYGWPAPPPEFELDFLGGVGCSCTRTADGLLSVHCPVGEKARLKVSFVACSDTITIENPPEKQRLKWEKLAKLDHCCVTGQNWPNQLQEYYQMRLDGLQHRLHPKRRK